MTFYVPAKYFEESFGDICVKTNDKDVRSCVVLFQERKKATNDLDKLLEKVRTNLLKYDKQELIQFIETDSKEWYEWSDNLIIFYACKYVLDGSPIPRYESLGN